MQAFLGTQQCTWRGQPGQRGDFCCHLRWLCDLWVFGGGYVTHWSHWVPFGATLERKNKGTQHTTKLSKQLYLLTSSVSLSV